MRGIFLDAGTELADLFQTVRRPGDPAVTVNPAEDVAPEALPALLAGYDFVLNDHTQMPTAWMARCTGLKHVIFLGTGARSYMNPEELAELGITVHIIKGYGDTHKRGMASYRAIVERVVRPALKRRLPAELASDAVASAYAAALADPEGESLAKTLAAIEKRGSLDAAAE